MINLRQIPKWVLPTPPLLMHQDTWANSLHDTQHPLCVGLSFPRCKGELEASSASHFGGCLFRSQGPTGQRAKAFWHLPAASHLLVSVETLRLVGNAK